MAWIGLGFAAFGFLVGTTAGLSTAELTITLLGLLFALVGGSVGAFLAKLDVDGRKLAGAALLSFSIFASAGLYSGLYIRINDLLVIASPETTRTGKQTKAKEIAYLKSGDVPLEQYLSSQIRIERMSLGNACAILDEQRGISDGSE